MSNNLPPIIAFFNDERNARPNLVNTASLNGSLTLFMGGQDTQSGLIDLYTQGHISSNNNITLILYNANSEKLYPSGTSVASGNWLNSDNNTSDMWSYVDEDPYNSFADNTSIRSYQSGYYVQPENLYWICESGIVKYNLSSTTVTKISDGIDPELSTHIAYNPIDDFIYYGVEDGNDCRLYRVDKNGKRETHLSSELGAGLAFSSYHNSVFSLDKDGDFKSLANEQYKIDKTSLLGRETQDRRLRINFDTHEIYALKTEATNYLTKIYKYNATTGLWDYVRLLSYGMFGGAFDIDYASGNIYYTATDNYFSPSYYGIVKESLTSGSGTRIVAVNSPTYFQTREIVFNQKSRKLYYVGEDISGVNKTYNLIRTDDLGGGSTTLLSLPESSGIKAMCLDGDLYKSYIDFDLTDLTSEFGLIGATQANISNAFVTVKTKNYNDFSYVRAKVLTSNKSNYIWYTDYSNGTPRLDSASGLVTYDIGKNSSSINSSYNKVDDWNGGILRLEVAASPSGNSDITQIDSINMTLISSAVTGTTMQSGVDCYITAHGVESSYIPLHILSDAGTGSIDLFLAGGVTVSGDIFAYTYGHMPVNSGVDFYIHGLLPELSATVYTYGHDVTSGNFTCYTSGLGVESISIPLFLSVHDPVEVANTTTLFTYGAESLSLFSTIDLFTTTIALVNPSSIMPLYIDGYGGIARSSSMNLFLKSETPTLSNTLDLTVGNYSSGVEKALNLTLWGPEGWSGSEYGSGTIPLVIGEGNEPVQNNITLFIKTQEYSYDSIPLMLEGQPNMRAELTLTISGIQPVNNSIWLYI